MISYSDPFVPELDWNDASLRSVDLLPAVREADAVVIVTDHTAFPYREIVAEARVVVDTRNAMRGIVSDKVVRL